MGLVLGLDIGTTSIKGVIVDPEGESLAFAKRDRCYVHPNPLWVEETHERFRESLFSLLGELASKIARSGDVVSLVIGAANGDTVFLDHGDQPIGNMRSWLDQRAVGEVPSLLPGLDPEEIHRVVGWPWDPRYPFAQTAWLRKWDTDGFSRLSRVATDVDYVGWLLSGKWGIDPSSAASLYFIDQSQCSWNTKYLASVGLSSASLSPLMPSGAPVGCLLPSVASMTGLPTACMVRPGAFDHACVARGAGILEEGDFLLSCGTSWVGALPVVDRQKAIEDGLVIDQYLSPMGPYLGLLDMGTVGEEIDKKRKAAGLTGGRDPHGLFESSSAAAPPLSRNIARALMEEAAFTARKGLHYLQERNYKIDRIIMAGGPANSPTWTRITASVLGREIELTSGQYTGAIGATIIGSVAERLFDSVGEAAAAISQEAVVVVPDPVWCEAYAGIPG
jgi:sugar (pentulose or hexulose) kinase